MTLTFAQIPAGVAVFLDANMLVYHFANDPAFGADCTRLLTRIEQQQLTGFLSTHCRVKSRIA
jgi:predicted nucleic acid-binding protein